MIDVVVERWQFLHYQQTENLDTAMEFSQPYGSLFCLLH
jgi:hypothetical protein